jgi:hypothetical protein
MPNFDNTQFCTVDDIRQLTAIGSLVDQEKIEPLILPAGIAVQAILGDNLTAAFKSKIYFANPVLSITAANPPVVTTAKAHGYTSGDIVAIDHPKGMINAEGSYAAIVTGPTTFQLWTVPTTGNPSTAWDGTGWGSYTTRSAVTFAMSVIRYKVFVRTRRLQALIAYKMAISNLSVNKANAGILEAQGNGFKPVSDEVLAKMRNEADSQANTYGAQISLIICEEDQEFPEVEIEDDHRTNPSGVFNRMSTF